jgi:hypothetical protein
MAKTVRVKTAIAHLDGLQAAVTGRLWREAERTPTEAATLRKLAGEVATDFERLRQDLRRGGEIASPDTVRPRIEPGG